MSPQRDIIADMDYYIERNIIQNGQCWEWQGYINPQGYGIAVRKINGKWQQIRAHRYVYDKLIGRISEGLHLDHLCLNKRCVNPSHLEQVTQTENNRRIYKAFNVPEQTCIRGHKYTPETSRARGDSKIPVCRICDNLRYQRRRKILLEKRRERYKNDPEYRAHCLSYNKTNTERSRGHNR